MALLMATLCLNNSRAEDTRENQLKAAYLLNFARFIYWPSQVFVSDTSPFVICIYGESGFGGSLKKLSSKVVNNRPIKIEYKDDNAIGENCNIVYIARSSEQSYKSYINQLPDYTLTVSDIEGFAQSSGMIEFIRIKNKLKFEINVVKSTEKKIKYRSQLLEVAENLR
jgi:hypothetical protein